MQLWTRLCLLSPSFYVGTYLLGHSKMFSLRQQLIQIARWRLEL